VFIGALLMFVTHFSKEFDYFCSSSEKPQVKGISINVWVRNGMEDAVYKVAAGNYGGFPEI